jgi:DNA-binding transcriptional MerR regulator
MKKFSDFTGVNQTTLRYYDRIGLFSPVERGENDYRHYSPMQIITINLINVLTDLGIPLKQISEMEQGRTPRKILSVLTAHEKELDAQMRHLYESYSTIHVLRELIRTGCEADESEVYDVKMDAAPLIMGEVNHFEDGKLFYEAFIKFYKQAQGMGMNLNYPVGGYFESIDAFRASDSQPTRFFLLDPHGHQQKPAGQYIMAYSRGYYGDMGDAEERITKYADEYGLEFAGPLYVVYVHDEISIKEPDRYLSQVSVLVKPKT